MPTKITTTPAEKGTYIITMNFADEDSSGVAPNSAYWEFTDIRGNVINSRTSVAIVSPTSQEYVVLSGDDLAISDSLDATRLFTVRALYNSGTYGDSLPLNASMIFSIDNLKAVT